MTYLRKKTIDITNTIFKKSHLFMRLNLRDVDLNHTIVHHCCLTAINFSITKSHVFIAPLSVPRNHYLTVLLVLQHIRLK